MSYERIAAAEGVPTRPGGKPLQSRAAAALGTGVTSLVIVVSGHSVVLSLGAAIVFPVVLLILAVIRYGRRGTRSRARSLDYLIVATFALLSAYHLATFSAAIGMAVLGFLTKLAVAWLVVLVVPDFPRRFVDAMVGLATLSLLFYVPQQLLFAAGVDLRALAAAWTLTEWPVIHVGLHNFHLAEHVGRNAGIFWEPGAFAGYLVVAIMALATYARMLSPRQYFLWLATLTVTLLTTQSTTGYLVLPVALLLQLPAVRNAAVTSRSFVLSAMAVLALVPAGWLAWEQVPFLSEKVATHYWVSDSQGRGWKISRLGNFMFDMAFVAERPFAGWSVHPITRGNYYFFEDDEVLNAQGNGLSGFAVRFGIIGLSAYVVGTYRALFGRFRRSAPVVLFVAGLLGVLFGEQFLNFPLLMTVMFWRPQYC